MNQEDLIGKHPQGYELLGKWLSAEDKPIGPGKKQRHLREIGGTRKEAIDWLAEKIVQHHISPERLKRVETKKQELSKLEFRKYVQSRSFIPVADRTKKGNGGEVLLSEYLVCSTQKRASIIFYKLRYNPNVEQAIKGDDVLLFDIENIDEISVFLGEAKFRATPSSTVVREIMDSLSKDKAPLSFGYTSEMLDREGNSALAEAIDDLSIDTIKSVGRITYIGLLISNENTEKVVGRHLNSDNDRFVFLSLGLDNPSEIIETSFQKAEALILESHQP